MKKNSNLLLELLRIALYSPYVKNGRMVNLLILAEPESGKTTAMKRFSTCNKGILYVSDITYNGLMDIVKSIYYEKKDIKTLIIGDLWKVIGRRESTALNIITSLNEVMEEGISRIYLGHGRNIELDTYIRLQVIGAITEIPKVRSILYIATTGFFTRMLPFSYSISRSKILDIFQKIANRDYSHESPIQLNFPKESIDIKIDKDYANKLTMLAMDIAKEVSSVIGTNLKGIRYADMLITLAQARALAEGRKEVIEEDIEAITEIADYMNINYKPL